MEKSLKNMKQEFKEKGIFYTTDAIAQKMKSYVTEPFKNVYDPTCGQGNLLRVFGNDVKKYGQELDPMELEKCYDIPNFTGVAGDTLTKPAFMDMKFDCIVANPPFSIKWEPVKDERFCAPVLPPQGKADYAFLLHILHLLSDDGIAVTLNFPGILYRGNAEGKIRQWLVDMNYITTIERIPPKQFTDTTIETVIVVFRKNKTNTDIMFIDGDKTRVVGIDEIRKNNYSLSVSMYISNETPKEVMDTASLQELQQKARENFLRQLRAELEFDKMVCDIEGWKHGEYVKMIRDELEKIVDMNILT